MASDDPGPAKADHPTSPNLTSTTASFSEETPLLRSTNDSISSYSSPDDENEQRTLLENRHTSNDAEPISPLRGFCVVFSLWLLIFIQASNMSGMTMIQGRIAQDLDTYSGVMWFSTAYLIALSSLGPIAARLADIFTPSSLILPITVAVSVGSLVSSQAYSYATFIAGRVITGVGGSGVLSLSIIVVLELTDKKRRGFFIGLVNAGFTFGVSFGAVVYGALAPTIGWRPLFWMQCPIAIVAGIALYASLPRALKPKDDRSAWAKLRTIDYLGACLLTLTIVLFLYGLAGEIQLLPLFISAGTLIAFILTEYNVANPLISPKSFSSRGILFSCLAQLGLMSARWTVLFYSPIWMLAVRGAAPATAGSILIPTNFGFGLGGMLVGALHVRRGGSFWGSCLVGIVAFMISIGTLSFFTAPTSPLPIFILLVFLNGLASGATLNYTLAHLLHHSHEGTQYITTSLLGTFRGFGGSFGTSIGGGIWMRALQSSLQQGFEELDGSGKLSPDRQHLISRLIGTPDLVFHGGLTPQEQQVAIASYSGSASLVWKAATILGVAVLLAQATTGWTGPEREVEKDEEEEARAHVLEHEGASEV